MQLRDVRKAKVNGRRVLIRVDYNIETTTAGQLRDIQRIKATRPTLQWLLRHGASVIIVTHRGRPTSRTDKWTVKPVVAVLRRLLNHPVEFVSTPIFSRLTQKKIFDLPAGSVVLLENIRYQPGEEKNDRRLAKRLASFADFYVNDAFATCHRAHASVAAITRYLPSYAGLLLQHEVKELSRIMNRPPRPFVAIIGGAKISTKLGLVKNLLQRTDHVLLGGALANTVLAAEGLAIGRSVDEPAMRKSVRGITVRNKHLKIPCDVIVAKQISNNISTQIKPVGKIGSREIILDIGPDTILLYQTIIKAAKTIVWNGPMGYYELSKYARGTLAIARAIAASRSWSIAGGGETIDAIARQKLTAKFSFISTGGGAMLEFLEGRKLPGLVAVTKH